MKTYPVSAKKAIQKSHRKMRREKYVSRAALNGATPQGYGRDHTLRPAAGKVPATRRYGHVAIQENRISLGSIVAPFMKVMVSCEPPPLKLTCQWVASMLVKVAPGP
jgi:hypothetical protein